MKNLRIKEIFQTCLSCPSQWEGLLEDERSICIRYRRGYLSIHVSHEPTHDILFALKGKQIYGKDIGGVFDGFIELEEVLKLSGLQFNKNNL